VGSVRSLSEDPDIQSETSSSRVNPNPAIDIGVPAVRPRAELRNSGRLSRGTMIAVDINYEPANRDEK
jgi:hypothetical protein